MKKNYKKMAVVNLITRTSLNRRDAPDIQSNKDSMIVKFVAEMKARGMDTELFVSDAYRPSRYENLGIKIHYLPTCFKRVFWPSRIPFTPSLFGKLRNNFDLFICSDVFPWGSVIAVLAKIFSRKKKVKIVIWQELSKHPKFLNRLPSVIFHKVILRFFLDPFISLYIPRSAQAARFLIDQGINAKKIADPVPHGYDQNIFFNDPSIVKKRYILSPSRLVFSKGIDVLLKSFARVTQQVNDLGLIIQGDGPLREEYMKLARDLGIEERVTFETVRLNHDEMRLRYQEALLTVISSREDFVIFSALESIACGTPVVLSSGVDSHIQYLDGKGGRYFQNEDFQELADILINILKDDSLQCRLQQEALIKSFPYRNSRITEQFLSRLGPDLE